MSLSPVPLLHSHPFGGFGVRQADEDTPATPGKITTKPPTSGNTLIVDATSRTGEDFVRTGFLDVDTGLITIVFFNDSASSMITDAFAATGDEADTWVYAAAFKDYLVDATSGVVGLKAVVRQVPGPVEPPVFPWSTTNISWSESLVSILSWEPSGVEQGKRDDDEDGIQNELDGQFSSSFVDESAGYSSSFSDQNLGGETFGSITDRSGLDVTVTDAFDSRDGLLLRAKGTGGGTATLSVCNTGVSLTDGDVATVTCGSLLVDVLVGPVQVPLTDEMVATVPSGASPTIKEVSSGSFEVKNTDGAVAVDIQLGTNITATVPGGAVATVTEVDTTNFTVVNDADSVESILIDVQGDVAALPPGDQASLDDTQPQPLPTVTPTAASTATPTSTPIAPTPTGTPMPTNTSVPLPTSTSTAAPTSTGTPTSTPLPTSTSTPQPTNTPVPLPTSTPTATPTPIPALGGFTWFTTARDLSLSTPGSWRDIDLLPFVPAGATGAIVEVVNTGTSDHRAVVRGKEDSRDYVFGSSDQEIEGETHRWQIVKMNSNLLINGFTDSTLVDFKLLGYTTGSDPVYFTLPFDLTPSTPDAWITKDISALVDADADGAILFIDSTAKKDRAYAIREEGSSFDTTNRELEEYGNTMYLVGQTKGSVVYYTDDIEVTDPPTNGWQPLDADDYAVPADANGLVFRVVDTSNVDRKLGLRHGDSSDDWVRKDIGGGTHLQAAVGISDANIWDEYVESSSVKVSIAAHTKGP